MKRSLFASAAVACMTSLLVIACGSTRSAGFGAGDSSGSFGEPAADGEGCSRAGQTEACSTGGVLVEPGKSACPHGVRTCVAQSGGEFSKFVWGPCVAAETTCDAGVDSGARIRTKATVIDAEPAPGCDSEVNSEPEIIVAYEPRPGTSVASGGQVKVWVEDEDPPVIAPGEKVDATTGAITTPGDYTSVAEDGYPDEPVLYINGVAYVPSFIKGTFANASDLGASGAVSGPPIDPNPSLGSEEYAAEYIWSVDSLGLSPGTYKAQFVIEDGDSDRGVGCVTIVIAP